ncbi:MAG: lysophospholipid acyltransferase family protein [Cyclobacteriaceae bacterium]|nr:lysophospholipid acyltransferase family protein [Cyclobacteriaceae bacterium]
MKLIFFISYIIPLRVFYLISDVAFWFFGYRKKIVLKNLRNSFPEASENEIIQISKQFYRRFFDFTMETIKAISISGKQLSERIHINRDDPFFQELGNTSIILLGSHIFSWELQGMAISRCMNGPGFFSYQRLKNPFFDKLILKTRTRFGVQGIEREKMFRTIVKNKDKKALFYILPDQSPFGRGKRYVTKFLNQDTAFYYGVGQIMEATKLPVWAVHCERQKRGHYNVVFTKIQDGGTSESAQAMLEKYIGYLENVIKDQPYSWLWTHNRWKTKWTENDIISNKLKNNEREN